jgi:hypothetical protein
MCWGVADSCPHEAAFFWKEWVLFLNSIRNSALTFENKTKVFQEANFFV